MIRLVTFIRISLLTILLSSKAFADQVNVGIECYWDSFSSQTDSGNKYYSREQIQDSDKPKNFFFEAQTTNSPLKVEDNGDFYSNSNGSLGRIGGDFAYLLNDKISWWIDSPTKYVFETIPDDSGRFHSISLDRYSGTLLHFTGDRKDRDRALGLSYIYRDCKKIEHKQKF